MATDFSLTPGGSALFRSQPLSFALALIGGAAGSNVSFALDDGGAGGVFVTSPVVITTGLTTGSFTYTPKAAATGTITITATATGGLVAVHNSALPINYAPNTVSAGQICAQAGGILGVKAIGEPMDGSELEELLDLLNGSVLDSWRTMSLFAAGIETITGTLKANTKTMTIGPSGDLVTANVPIAIQEGSYFTSGNGNYPIRAITAAQWNGIFYKTLSTLGPDCVWYDNGLPNGMLSFYPQPAGDTPISIQVLVQLAAFADLSTQYQLLPGYRKALAYSLAEEAQSFYQVEMSASALKQGALARRQIQRVNHVTPSMSFYNPQSNILAGFENR